MANVKITELTALTSVVDADVLEIVDDVAGTPTSKKVTVANLAGAPALRSEDIVIALSDETTQITTGLKVTFRMPFAMTLTDIKVDLTTAGRGSTVMDVHEGATGGTSIMTTNQITIEASELTSDDATTQPTLTDTSLAANAIIGCYIDTAGTSATGAKITLTGYRT
jgi:hypothetical protein